MIKTVSLSNGIEIEIEQRGEKPELLFLHGFGDSYYVWTPLLEHMEQDYISMSLRGFGGSSKAPQVHDYTLDAFTEDVVLLLDALNIDTINLIGHSLGSFIALRVAAQYPERINNLLLLGTAADNYNEAQDMLMKFISQYDHDNLSLEFIQSIQKLTARPLYNPEVMLRIAQESTRSNLTVWKGVLTALRESEHRSKIIRITAPTLLLWGSDDHIYRRKGLEEFERLFPTAKLEVFEGLGHAFFLEKPALAAASINAFLNKS